MTTRRDYGIERTTCGCEACRTPCKHIPGMLSPLDLERLAPVQESFEAVLAWARQHLLASPGATAIKDGRVIQIPTLVPARQAGKSACHWLGDDGMCQVHENSPFGCAMCDTHIGQREGQGIVSIGLQAIIRDIIAKGLYWRLWEALHGEGLIAPSAGESRRKMAEAQEKHHAGTAEYREPGAISS